LKAATSSQRILLTGAGRGLGLEFTRRWLEAGHRVFALVRNPENSPDLRELGVGYPRTLVTLAGDVTDDDSVVAARRAVESLTDGLDLVLNNAGIYGPKNDGLESLDWKDARRVIEVNTLGPLRVSRAFLPLLRRGSRPRLVHITSLMGSLADNRSGGAWAYRMSKAALNMASRNLAHELAQSRVISVVLHPGWVRTDMGGSNAPLGVGEAVAALVETIDSLTLKQSGGFFDRHGRSQPW